MDEHRDGFTLTAPKSKADWTNYFDLRWRVLRAPWNRPRGSERDDQEDQSIHLMVCDPDRRPLAVGRLHFRSQEEAQVRYMAVDQDFAGRGLGGRVLRGLEQRALSRGAMRIVLNARKNAVPFYLKHGYGVTGPAETLYGVIEHFRMVKELETARGNGRVS